MQSEFKRIESAHNDEIKQLARLLQNGRERRQQRLMVLEGIHLLETARASHATFAALYVNERARGNAEVEALLDALAARCRVTVLAEALFGKVSALSSAPEILALVQRPEHAAAAASASRLLLENVQDPGNLGTILRSAAAADVRDVYLSAGCVDAYSPKVLRAGMGAHFALNLREDADLAAELLAFDGARLVTSLEGSQSLYRQDLRGPVAFVFGNEGAGVSRALLDLADVRVRIPMPGQAESLNVAMAATLCLFERVRQLYPD
ncbi:TrmH family RNA methyltransferase [Paludibacterium yongneupense]|uniref:TrmH family RNA methyltransferase n=1 Tax=Paludibacterium yongneupense TaxID=400061 RepID=UPI000421B7E7|nr:RNA methyltransferase [Paludibacterium yongneupense]